MINTPTTEEIQTLEKLHENLKKNIDARKNSQTTLEAEIKRLQDLVTATEYTISEQTKTQNELKNAIGQLEIQKSDCETKITDLQSQIDGLTKQKTDLNSEIADLKKVKNDTTGAIAEREVGLTQREKKLEANSSALESRSNELSQKEKMLNEKHESIKQLVSKLN